jgi:hypothetical protein
MADEKKSEPAGGNLTQPKFDPDIVKRFLEIQQQEILVRQNELLIRGKDIDNQKDIALKSIEAQQQDLKDDRVHKRRSSIIVKIFVLLLTLVTVALIVYLIEKGKDTMAVEILKIVGVALISFGGGYFYGRSNQKSGRIDTQQTE